MKEKQRKRVGWFVRSKKNFFDFAFERFWQKFNVGKLEPERERKKERGREREREREEQKSVNFFSAPSTYSLIPKQTKVEVREERKKERKRERKRRNLIKVFEIPTADIIPNTN